MRDDFGALFAASALLRDDPTASELAGGIPCGPFRQKLLNELFFASSSMLSELNTLLDTAGIAPDETQTSQLLAAIRKLAPELPAPASTVQFTLATTPQSVPNNTNTQIGFQGSAPPWATFASSTVTVTKAGIYTVNLVGVSNIAPSAQTSHNTTFTIYINGQGIIPQTMVNWTNTTQQIGLSNSYTGYLPAGSTIAGWTYLGNSGTTDVCQVVSALLNVTKVS
jgi:hypothetical protein